MDKKTEKIYMETMLQIIIPSGDVKSCHHRSSELSVTEPVCHNSWESYEYSNQKKLKEAYETGNGCRVMKKQCANCGKIFYTMNHFRKFCHLSQCREISRYNRNEERKRENYSEHVCSVCSASRCLDPPEYPTLEAILKSYTGNSSRSASIFLLLSRF